MLDMGRGLIRHPGSKAVRLPKCLCFSNRADADTTATGAIAVIGSDGVGKDAMSDGVHNSGNAA